MEDHILVPFKGEEAYGPISLYPSKGRRHMDDHILVPFKGEEAYGQPFPSKESMHKSRTVQELSLTRYKIYIAKNTLIPITK